LRTKSIDEIESLLKTIKKVRIEKSRKGNLIDFIVFSGLKGSKSEVKRIMENGGLYINNVRVIEVNDM
jgi:tyrosyl-tRNA synthetase